MDQRRPQANSQVIAYFATTWHQCASAGSVAHRAIAGAAAATDQKFLNSVEFEEIAIDKYDDSTAAQSAQYHVVLSIVSQLAPGSSFMKSASSRQNN
jgi:hypothetical protein